MCTMQHLAALSRAHVPAAIAGLDLQTEQGCTAARLRLATSFACAMTTEALLCTCRVLGMQHVAQGHQAAHALAVVAIPSPVSREEMH
ncbi:hypothetical protein [Paracraurococcus lichenis]|uniref:Uncharacterized protein n=1 Tax=Paracraurococcus lichenis TaxID=3064888 RepID=A0ABT9E8B2_9PROT|nr:hypothetical protein [Paracraurococcus sp. LOR1-02]MDO9712381.1 hypothetical protein [Paracraurococcus sp. LOR1-02]